MNLLIATENTHKLEELTKLLADTPFKIYSVASQLPDFIPPPEDGLTFEDNAKIKIQTLPLTPNRYYLADDSGLEVAALNGRPGIYSARYGGPGLTDLDRCHHLLAEMSGVADRKAQFTCVISLMDPNGSLQTFSGVVKGTIATEIRGNKGFGYDPLFIPDGYQQTFAEAGPSLKKTCSHRTLALTKTKQFIQTIFT